MSLFQQYLKKRNDIQDNSAYNKLDVDGVFSHKSKNEFAFDIDAYIEKAKKGEKLSEHAINLICTKVKDIFAKEKNVVKLNSPITLVGDVHGQFYDVLELFRVGGEVPDTNYLFLGDYVDRGAHSVETITLLMLLKLRFP